MSAAVRVRNGAPWAAIFVVAAGMSSGCVDTLLGPAGPEDDPVPNFDQLWTEADRHYAFFEEKGIDWNAVYQVNRAGIVGDSIV